MDRTTRTDRTALALKSTALVGVFGLLVAVATANATPPAGGYEISLYRVFPWYFWGGLVAAVFLGMVVVAGSVHYGDRTDRSWVFGVALIAVSGCLVVSMPYVRGYPVYGRGDVLTHVGFVHDIAAVGLAGNIYPLIHVLAHTLSHATGLPTATVVDLLPVAMAFVFLGGLFYLARGIYSRTHALYALPFVLVLVLGLQQAKPFALSTLYVPFVLYLFVREQRTSAVPVRVFLVVSVFGVVLYHPLTTVFLLVVLGLYLALKTTNAFESGWAGPTVVPSLTVVAFAAWYVMSFVGIVRRFETVVGRFTGSLSGQSELQTVAAAINTFSPEPLDLATIAALEYGTEVVIYSLAGLFVGYAALRWLRGGGGLNVYLTLIAVVYALFTGLAVLFFVNDFIVGWGRVLAFENVFVAILCASLFYALQRHASTSASRHRVFAAMSVVLLVLAVVGVASAFPSLPAREHNNQVTEMEIQGTEWVLDNREDGRPVDAYRISLWRFEHLHSGTLNESVRQGGSRPPEHFGYRGNDTLGGTYGDERYLIVTALGRLTYPEIYTDYPDFWGFTPADFERLETDTTVSRVYDNGEFDLYAVSPPASTSPAENASPAADVSPRVTGATP